MERYECDQCGACCGRGAIIIEIDELDLIREPQLMAVAEPFRVDLPVVRIRDDEDEVRLGPVLPGWEEGAMLACGEPCKMLAPDLNDPKKHLCTIYPTRPNCCVAFRAGSERCQELREGKGLPRLLPL